MVINKIITKKELNYIETLYLYLRIEDINEVIQFVKAGITLPAEDVTPRIRYKHAMAYIHDNILSSAEYIGYSHGRSWYSTKNYRLGIMDIELAISSNQYTMEIQYNQSHMYSLDSSLEGLDLPIPLPLSSYHIKRIDLTKIIKTPIDYLTNHSFVSPYRTIARFEKNGITETVYLGNRKNGNVYRMYNKTKELQVDTKEKPIDFLKIEKLSSYFGDIEDLYTFELELHRRYLRSSFGIETLADLDKIYAVNSEIVGKIKIYEDTDINKSHILCNNYDRIDFTYITEYKEYKRLKQKDYKPSKQYLIDKTKSMFERYEDSLGKKMSRSERILLSIDILTNLFPNEDCSIELEDNLLIREYNSMYEKIENLRLNESDRLDKEAKEAFKKVDSNPNLNPFL